MVLGIFYPQVVVLPSEDPDRTRLISTTELIAKWRLEDLVEDWFNQFTLTNNGSVVFKRGRFKNCAKFDGSNHLSRAHIVTLNPKLKDFTMIVDFRVARGNAATRGIYGKLDDTGINTGYRIFLQSDNILRATVGDGTNTANVTTSPTTYDDGKWHRVIVVVDRTADTITIYVDDHKAAVASASISVVTGSIESTVAFTLGAKSDGTQLLIGEIDNAYLYFRKLTLAEIKVMMLANDKIIVDVEERGGEAECSQLSSSQFSMNFDGSDTVLKDRYVPGSLLCFLHDIVDLDKIRAIWNMKTIDDEALYKNTLVLQADPLLSEYTFENGNAKDSKGTNNGTWTGTEKYIDGPGPGLLKIRGRAADFGGAERITLANEANFDFEHSDPFSVSFWFKRADLGTQESFVFKSLSTAAASSGWRIFLNAVGRVIFELSNGTTDNQIVSATNQDDGKWHYVLVTYAGLSNKSGMKMYVDGVLVATGTADPITGSILNNESVVIGAESDAGNPLTGQMARVRIFNKELNLDQANSLFKQDQYEFLENGGLICDAAHWYKITENENLSPDKEFSIEGELQIPASTSGSVRIIIQKSTTNLPFGIFVRNNLLNELRFRTRIGGVNREIDFIYTPGTKFKFLWTVSVTNNRVRLYINGVQQGADLTTSGTLFQSLDDVSIGARHTDGANLALSGTQILRLKMWDRELTAAEATDANALIHPKFNCLFDGIIMEQPIKRKANLPFKITAKDFLFDRLVNDDITQQFSEVIDLGAVVRRIVKRSSIVNDFNTDDVEDVNVTTNGKYFIRTKLIDAFNWAMDNENGTFYTIRRGFTRYLTSHIIKKLSSGVSIAVANIVKQGGSKQNPLFYNWNNAIFPQSNIIQVEGGFEYTIEEQVTFDNGTTKSGELTYYGLKSTPEFIKYGRLEIKVSKVGDPQFDVTVQLREEKAGEPAGPEVIPLASVAIPRDEITDEKALIALDFDVVLDTAKTYWLVFFLGGDPTNHYEFSDNGGSADTNMQTSPDDSVWSTVGFTFVYNWQHKLRVISQTKDGSIVKKFQIRKITVADPTITKQETARTLARGLLARLGKVHIMLQNVMLKDISALPCAGQTVQFTDALTGIDEPLEVQKIKIPLLPGRNGEIRRPIITVGDRDVSPEILLQQLLRDLRNQIEAEQPVTTDTKVFAEGFKVGVVVTGRFIPPFKGKQDIGIDVTFEANSFALEGDANWDEDDVAP